MSRTRRFVAGVSTGYLVSFVGIIVSLAITPLTLRYLNAEEYGIFTLASNVINFLALIDFGIASGIRVHLSQNIDQLDSQTISRYVSSGFFVQLLIVMLVVLFGMIMSIFFPVFFEVKDNLRDVAIWTMALLTLGNALSLLTQPFSSILIAYQQTHIDNMIRLGLLVIRTAMTVVLLVMGYGLLSLALANLVANIVSSVFMVVRTRRLVPGLQIATKLLSKEIIFSTGRTGVWITLGAVAGLLINNLDTTVAAKLISMESVTTLAITGKVYLLSQTLLYQITNTARPGLGQLIGQKKIAQAVQTYHQLFALSTGLAIMTCASLWVVNETFIKTWLAGDDHYGGQLLDLAFALNLLINVSIIPSRATLTAGLQLRPQVIVRVVEGVLNLVFSVVLTLRFGLIGVIMSTALAAAITSLFYLPYLTARMFNQSFKEFVMKDMARVALVLVLLAPIMLAIKALTMQIDGYVGVMVGGVLAAGASMVGLWFIVFDEKLRQRVSGLLVEGKKLILNFRSV